VGNRTKRIFSLSVVALAIVATLFFGAASATEKFQKSDDKLFIH